MAYGLGRLAWPPEAFWAATPRELAAALRAHAAPRSATPPARATLERLMALHPDDADRDRSRHG